MTTLDDTIRAIAPVELDPDGAIQQLLDNKTKPPGSLGRLEELAIRYCSIRGNYGLPTNKVIFTLAGDHGVVDAGVSAAPREVTAQMVLNFLNGGAAINVLARHVGARVVVGDIAVESDLPPSDGLVVKKVMRGTNNMVEGPAMSRDQAIRSIEAGIEIFEEEYPKSIDICAVGEMGIGNTTPSSAIISVIGGVDPVEVTGRGTGVDDQGLRRKTGAIRNAIELNRPDPSDPLDVLAKVGGCEIGAIAGVCLAAARRRVPVVIDGLISTAGALIACRLKPETKGYLITAHKSVEKGHEAMLILLGARPLLDLNMRLGEGTGAALAMSLVEASIKILREMASFDDAKVSR